MAKMVLGIFSNQDMAETALDSLSEAGYDPKDISIIMGDGLEKMGQFQPLGSGVVRRAISGVALGGSLGALVGLLIGSGTISIPGVGAFLIGGLVSAALGLTGAAATTVSGAITGALAGGLVGTLVGLGVPEEDVRLYYERKVKSGAMLVAVPVTEDREDEVRESLETHGAAQIRALKFTDVYQPTPKREYTPAFMSRVRRKKGKRD